MPSFALIVTVYMREARLPSIPTMSNRFLAVYNTGDAVNISFTFPSDDNAVQVNNHGEGHWP